MHRVVVLAVLAAACKPKPAADVVIDEPADQAPSCPVDDGTYDDLAALFDDDRLDWDAPGRAVAVFKDGEIVWCAGLGSRNPRKKSEGLEPDAIFRIASITKPITAIGVLQEVEAGSLSLDETVPSIIGDWDFWRNPGWTSTMTVAHLLTQEAAIYDYLAIEGSTKNQALRDFVEGDLVNDWFLTATPGSFWNYSNDNFIVAGRVLEVATGRSYSEKITDDVLLPLGMERTFFDPDDVLADGNYASSVSYDWDGLLSERRVEPDSYDNGWGRPAGYVFSNVVDLSRLGIWAMDGGGVLGDELRYEMQAPIADLLMPLPGISHYGYGWFSDVGLQTSDGLVEVPTVYHMGDMPGFAADLYLFPGEGVGVAVLTSKDYAHVSADILAETVATFAELPDAVPLDIDVSDLDLNQYVATYNDPYNVGTMEFYVDGDDLMLDMPLLDTNFVPYSKRLIPWTPDNFYLQIQGLILPITFIEEGGEFRWARTRFFVGQNENVAPTARSQPDPTLLAERLKWTRQAEILR